MKIMIASKIKQIIKSIGLKAQCFLLLLKNLLFLKMIPNVKWLALYDRVVIEGNEVSLLWKVNGCHTIKVEGIGIIKGNTNGLSFKLADITKPIEIYFYGIVKTEHKTISFIGDKVNLLNPFHSTSSLPQNTEAVQSMNRLENKFSNSKLKSTFKAVTFEFDSFVQNEYQQ